jgi:hypothetical protein
VKTGAEINLCSIESEMEKDGKRQKLTEVLGVNAFLVNLYLVQITLEDLRVGINERE